VKVRKIYSEFLDAQKYIYEPLSFTCTQLQPEAEGKEYGACTFEMNGKRVLFRAAKITSTKVGQFVTLWKRIGNGPIMPYDISDPFNLCIIHVSANDKIGQFVFPKDVLLKHGVISQNDKGGKRAMRVYPAWDIVNNKQAQKTQEWQLQYFFKLKETIFINIQTIKNLFL
jgi:hypothetical protein